MRLGQGHKSLEQDLDEVIDSLNEYKEYLDEQKTNQKVQS
jgi:hypothetical protein